MTALARIHSTPTTAGETSIMNGAGTELFTNGLLENSTDMRAGEAVQMFTTGGVTADSSAGGGDKAELFTTSC